jgi:diadenosine tetraphosphatase ApaH/serine/threonine PP2A family protein phosphatase
MDYTSANDQSQALPFLTSPCYHPYMRILIISDIHANLTALEAVLKDAGEFDGVWCLGDLVGYGPDPNECIERIQTLPELHCLVGNHDHAALGMIPISRFNQDAQSGIRWTMDVLTQENKDYLKSLPAIITLDNFTLAHGSPREPIWEYILDVHLADANFDFIHTDYCLVGHSHLPLIFYRRDQEDYSMPMAFSEDDPLPLKPRMILNPGSVGQPRDLDPRAAYAILELDDQTWEPKRVPYDITDVQLRILQSGLPERHATRLVAGW